MAPNVSGTILALAPAVGTARMRNVVHVCARSVVWVWVWALLLEIKGWNALERSGREQLDTVSPTWLAIGRVSKQSGQGIGTVARNISSMNGVLS